MKFRHKLFSSKQPYDNNSDEIFLNAVRENALFHYRHCAEYRKILDGLDFGEKEILSEKPLPEYLAKLPRREILHVLRRKKNYLQTAGLICSDADRGELSDILARSGVTRITTAGAMSEYFAGEAHDGEYPLRRYTRIVNNE